MSSTGGRGSQASSDCDAEKGGRAGGRGRGRGGRGGSSGGGRGNQPHSNSNQQHINNQQRHTRQTQQRTKLSGGRGRGRYQNKHRPRSQERRDEYLSAKKLVEGPYAHLFCSQRHGFALSRTLLRHQIEDDQEKHSNGSGLLKLLRPYSHKDADDQNYRITSSQLEIWWETVKVVRCHAPMNESDSNNKSSSLERCPICLDEDMTTPYIAPCGHSFCLPCVLGYLNAVAHDLNTESENLHKNKQNKCSGVVGGSGCVVPNAATVTCVRARCPMCSSGSSMVLNAGEAMITYKDLRPLVFVPVISVKDLIGVRREGNPTKMKFVKLHRSKGSCAPYLPIEGHRVMGSHSMQYFPDLPDGDDDSEECIYARQYFVGLSEFSSLLEREIGELESYRNQPECRMDHREDLNVSMALAAVQASQRRWIGSGGVEGFFSIESDVKIESSKYLQDKLVISTKIAAKEEENQEVETNCKLESKRSSLLCPGTCYLHLREPSDPSCHDSDEFFYYQSCDGQLCFLSGFDVACLMNEFSLHNTLEDGSTNYDRSKMPLPDEVLATVIATEDEVLTHSLLRRKQFLSHYPLNCTVSFVEIDWNSGGDGGNKPLLSHRTLSKFRDELHHRKAERTRQAKKEQKADKAAREKAEKRDRQRRLELLGAHSTDGFEIQTIDPDDEFFRAVAITVDDDDDDEANLRLRKFSFNQVCAEGGVFPELSSTMAASPPKAHSWGRNKQSPKSPREDFPSLSESYIALDKKDCEGGSNRWG